MFVLNPPGAGERGQFIIKFGCPEYLGKTWSLIDALYATSATEKSLQGIRGKIGCPLGHCQRPTAKRYYRWREAGREGTGESLTGRLDLMEELLAFLNWIPFLLLQRHIIQYLAWL